MSTFTDGRHGLPDTTYRMRSGHGLVLPDMMKYSPAGGTVFAPWQTRKFEVLLAAHDKHMDALPGAGVEERSRVAAESRPLGQVQLVGITERFRRAVKAVIGLLKRHIGDEENARFQVCHRENKRFDPSWRFS